MAHPLSGAPTMETRVNEYRRQSSYDMTVDTSSKRPRVVVSPSRIRGHSVAFALLLAASASIAPDAIAQGKSSVWPAWADTTGESDVYPVGDAVGVYRAVLDLLYIDGGERPSVIVLWDTAQRQSGGPCALKCKEAWPHKSKMDTATILAYARPSRKRPRIIDFGYRIPIVRVSEDNYVRIAHDGLGYLAARPPQSVGGPEAFWVGFRHKFPRAWGSLMLSKVAFNAQHTEALIGVFQACGETCRSFEAIFLKRFGNDWRVIERIPESAEAMETHGNLRYRGPAGERPDQSQIVAIDSSGSAPRAESDDASGVYRAVLDRLYSFYGERPRAIVVTVTHPYTLGDLPNHRSKIDSSTVSSYNLYAQVRDDLRPRFDYRFPVSWLSEDDLKRLEREGAPLAKAAVERFEDEQSPLWHAFHAKYPDAWGYASLGKVAFNPQHTQALVFSRHFCGTYCINADTWFLERKNDNWYVVERMPRENQVTWGLDGLRYLGPEIDAKTYSHRRVHGVVMDAATGKPAANLTVRVNPSNNQFTFFTTDAEGRYSIENPPVGSFSLAVKCPASPGGTSLEPGVVAVRPGLDSTVNFQVEMRVCQP
jgi:hypothetical protein